MTHLEYLNSSKVNQRAVAYRLRSIGITNYCANQDLTASQIEQLESRFGSAKMPQQKQKRVLNRSAKTHSLTVATVATVAQIENKKTESGLLFYAPFAVTLLSIALTISGLFMFAGWFGFTLGSMFGLFLFGASIVARNKQKGDTSASALNTVLYLELGACLLHVFTFYAALESASNEILRWSAAFVCASFVAIISYNSINLIRNYNAE